MEIPCECGIEPPCCRSYGVRCISDESKLQIIIVLKLRTLKLYEREKERGREKANRNEKMERSYKKDKLFGTSCICRIKNSCEFKAYDVECSLKEDTKL